jgi:hypothetical protein
MSKVSAEMKKIYNQRYREKKRLEKMQKQQQEKPLNEITVDENESIDTVQEIKPIHVPEKSLSKEFEAPPPIQTEFTESDEEDEPEMETKHVTFDTTPDEEMIRDETMDYDETSAELDAYLDQLADKILEQEMSELEVEEPSDKKENEPAKENFFLAAMKSSMMNVTAQLIQVGTMSAIGLLLSKLVQKSKPLPVTSTQDTNQNSNGVEMPTVDLEIPVVNF